jgi:hypothetical protein
MSNESCFDADGFGSVTTTMCHSDSQGTSIEDQGLMSGSAFEAEGELVDAAALERGGATGSRKPILTHTFEFRLSGSEGAEQSRPLPPPAPPGLIVAIRSVRTYLTRQRKKGT